MAHWYGSADRNQLAAINSDYFVNTRVIHLRRPAVLQMQDQLFVPGGDAALFDAIKQRWRERCAANPALHDGRLTHVIGVHRNGYGGAVLHVADCAYRYHAVQDDDFDLGVRSLGVKAFTRRDAESLLLGKRAHWVNAYGGMWEFAPGGVVEPGREPDDVITAELREETGLRSDAPPMPIALLYDEVLRCWEIVFDVRTSDSAVDLSSGEYDEIRWCAVGDWPKPMTPIARQMVKLLRA